MCFLCYFPALEILGEKNHLIIRSFAFMEQRQAEDRKKKLRSGTWSAFPGFLYAFQWWFGSKGCLFISRKEKQKIKQCIRMSLRTKAG